MIIINEALIDHDDIAQTMPSGCSQNLDACQCAGNCETIKWC